MAAGGGGGGEGEATDWDGLCEPEYGHEDGDSKPSGGEGVRLVQRDETDSDEGDCADDKTDGAPCPRTRSHSSAAEGSHYRERREFVNLTTDEGSGTRMAAGSSSWSEDKHYPWASATSA
jgi:hypothetical protein